MLCKSQKHQPKSYRKSNLTVMCYRPWTPLLLSKHNRIQMLNKDMLQKKLKVCKLTMKHVWVCITWTLSILPCGKSKTTSITRMYLYKPLREAYWLERTNFSGDTSAVWGFTFSESEWCWGCCSERLQWCPARHWTTDDPESDFQGGPNSPRRTATFPSSKENQRCTRHVVNSQHLETGLFKGSRERYLCLIYCVKYNFR